MQRVSSVIRRIESGCSVTIIKNGTGQDRVELRRAWSPLKTVVALTDYEMALVEVALGSRRRKSLTQAGSGMPTVATSGSDPRYA